MPDYTASSETNASRASIGSVPPERLARILQRAAREILGDADLSALLDSRSFPQKMPSGPTQPADSPAAAKPVPGIGVDRLLSALETTYGPQAGQGLALRIGRACFRYGVREYGDQMGLNRPEFRMLPLPARLKAGLQALALWVGMVSTRAATLSEQDGMLLWSVELGSLGGQRPISRPVGYLMLGLLQETLYWLSGGRSFHAEEAACQGRGDGSCRFIIDPSPLAD